MTVIASLQAAADALDASVDELTRLDAIAGDGDLGITAAKVAHAIREACGADAGDAPTILGQCGRNIALTAASSCGTLLASAFLSASKAVGEGEARQQLAAGLDAAVEGVIKRGKAARGDRTLIDALGPAADAARDGMTFGSWAAYLDGIAAATQAGMEATKTMTPRIGRARTQPARAEGNPDAGSALVTIALTAALAAAARDEAR